MSEYVDLKVFNWFQSVERINVQGISKTLYESEVEDRRDEGRPCTSWLHGF